MDPRLEHFIKTREFEVFARLKDIPTPDLTLFAYDCDKGFPLEKYCNGITVDEVLRSLAALQVLRELGRRQDLAELDDDGVGE